MKLTISILLVLILILFVSGMNIFSRENRTEQQNFKELKKFNDFEIRYYPEAVLATVYSDAQTYRELSGPGFNTLAGYIFGGNQNNEKIAMTAPVHMDIDKGKSSMSFVMPGKYKLEELPSPNNPSVKVSKSPEDYVAVIRFGGWTNDQKIKEYSQVLEKLLRENNIIHKGNFRYLGYNPPFQLNNRRNEIIVSVEWEK
jgi:hypothetical protein